MSPASCGAGRAARRNGCCYLHVTACCEFLFCFLFPVFLSEAGLRCRSCREAAQSANRLVKLPCGLCLPSAGCHKCPEGSPRSTWTSTPCTPTCPSEAALCSPKKPFFFFLQNQARKPHPLIILFFRERRRLRPAGDGVSWSMVSPKKAFPQVVWVSPRLPLAGEQ